MSAFKKSMDVAGNIVKRKTVPILIASVVFMVLAFALLLIFKRDLSDYEFYIFESIEECDAIEKITENEADFEKYQNSDKDKNLKDLDYKKFFGGHFESSELEFELFAYEFYDAVTSAKYYSNATETEYEQFILGEPSINTSQVLNKARIVVIDEERVYVVYTSSADFDETIDFLGGVFQKRIETAHRQQAEE